MGVPQQLTIPRALAASLATDEDDRRRVWSTGLPRTVAELAERWSLHVGEPFEPGGTVSWVAPARTAAGDDVVLKVAWRHYESDHEPDGLQMWNGSGAVRLFAVHETQTTSALLIERCVPGTALGETAPEREQDVIVCGLLRRLWIEPSEGHRLRPLQTMCDQWAAGFERKLARAPDALDPGVARDGIALFRTLPSTADREVVLVTDLHAANVLAAEREPWLVVDPKPYVGDPAYDAVQHMLNCPARLAADPVALAHRMADLLDLDRDRVVQWLFARCVQESPGWPGLDEVALRLAAG